jgi:hypothetical protein
MMINDDEKLVLRRTEQGDLQPKERTRVDIALGNMRAHLYMDRERPVWTTVNRDDLEAILDYVNTLKLAPLRTLEEFADFIDSLKSGELDENTLKEVSFKARSKAARIRYELKRK